eukprot:11498839-Alexandrium_andersonii.AAC.1
MQIFVQTASGRVQTLEVEPCLSIRYLQRAVRREYGVKRGVGLNDNILHLARRPARYGGFHKPVARASSHTPPEIQPPIPTNFKTMGGASKRCP